MSHHSRDDEQFNQEVKYTVGEVDRMTVSWTNLAGAFCHSTVHMAHDIYRDLPMYQASHDLIQKYFDIRRENYGCKSSEEYSSRQMIKKSIFHWISKEAFLRTLTTDEAPQFDKLNIAKRERANIMTLWYACQLTKVLPELFNRSQVTREPFKIDPYDAVHAVCILRLYYKMILTKSFQSIKPQDGRPPIPPRAGAFGEGGNTETVGDRGSNSGATIESQMALVRHYYGPFSQSQRALIVNILKSSRGPSATEQNLRHMIRSIDKTGTDGKGIEAPAAMDKTLAELLLRHSVGEYFFRKSLIYEPEDMTSVHASSEEPNLTVTEVPSSGENITSYFEPESEMIERSRSQTKQGVPGEWVPRDQRHR